jgi:carboxypeptidase C (cathepsin A)
MKTRMLYWSVLAVGVNLLSTSGPASPAPPQKQETHLPAQAEEIVVTHHQITLNGQPLKYTAHTGCLQILDNATGEAHAHVCFTAYTVDRAAAQPPRSLTFVWNGGPSSNSTLVHLVGFGPRRIKGEDDPVNPPAFESAMEDNQGTWLDASDLVFVDPVGTGFSRALKPEYEKEFYSVLGDIASIAEFIRVYRTRFALWDAPLFLAGESYGTWRASGVAEALEQGGIKVTGVVLISGGVQVGSVGSDEMKTALYLPRLTAAALFHKKLAPELQSDFQAAMRESEAWAREQYASALEKRDRLTLEERQAIIAKLARFTGLNPAVIDREQFNLTLSSSMFCSELLKDQNLTCALLDDRVTRRRMPHGQDGVISRYFRSELEFNPGRAYAGVERGFAPSPERSIGQRWEWNQAKVAPPNPAAHVIYGLGIDPSAALHRDAIVVGSGNGPPALAEPWLRRAMMLDPDMRVFITTGLYDSLNSCLYIMHLIGDIEPRFGHNMKGNCYNAGHVIYATKDARLALKGDFAAFIHDSVTARPATSGAEGETHSND